MLCKWGDRCAVPSAGVRDSTVLDPHHLFALIYAVTFATSAVIVSDEARRRALDARVLSALWILEPGGNLSLLRFLLGPSLLIADVRHALKRLEQGRLIRSERSSSEVSYAVTPAGLYALERGGLGVRQLLGDATPA